MTLNIKGNIKFDHGQSIVTLVCSFKYQNTDKTLTAITGTTNIVYSKCLLWSHWFDTLYLKTLLVPTN